jgi:hypothetical protein
MRRLSRLLSVVFAALACVLLSAGCTARFSQSLAGSMPAQEGELKSASDTGLSILGIAVQEPKPAHELVTGLLANCKQLVRVQVDYRELVFVVVGLPKVTVAGYCVQ